MSQNFLFLQLIRKKQDMAELKYLFRKKHYIGSAGFLIAFSIAFLAIYNPFSKTLWLSFEKGHLLMTLGFYLSCVVIIAGTRVAFSLRNRSKGLNPRFVVFNILTEFALIAVSYVLFSFRFTSITFVLVLRTMFCVAMILAIPYTIYYLYASFRAMREENNILRLQIEKLERDAERMTENAGQANDGQRLLNLSDSNGSLKLTIEESSICYVESQDNYVNICYELNGEIASYMLRCSSNRFVELCAGTRIVRCHRSYFINSRRIRSIRYESRRSYAVLDMPGTKEIPISKTYIKAFSELGIS